MIDRKSFSIGMGVLAERCGRNLPAPVQSGYYRILSSELTTEEYQIAIQLAFRHARFWPSPQELIDYVRPPNDMALEAAKMFDHVQGMGWGGVFALHSPPVLAAYTAIGGPDALQNATTQWLPQIRREFVAAYKAKATETKAQREIEAVRANLSIAEPKRARINSGPVPLARLLDQATRDAGEGPE